MKPLLTLDPSELKRLGIVDWGYTEDLKARSFQAFSHWLKEHHEALPYLGTQQSIYNRENIKHWFSEAAGALVFLFDYTPAKKESTDFPKVAGYALGFEGLDYHDVLAPRLHEIASHLGLTNYKLSLDTQPILERDLAYRAGLGWFGKNAMLISPKHGSYFIIAALIVSTPLSLEVAGVEIDHCGNCTACVEACPTQAIDPVKRTIIAQRCISTWTIEDRREDTPAIAGYENSRGEIFGCDICQDVCPWNRKPLDRAIGYLSERAQFWREWYHQPTRTILESIQSLSGRALQRFMQGTPFMRPSKKTLIRALEFWIKRGPTDGSRNLRN
jgi:epoxyqueuosine reductase